jgi:DNA mismatch endonuclease (patch repair protein)
MTDKFNTMKRSDIMSKVKSENTTPELIVRKLLFSMGFRYRLHKKDLSGKPDIVMAKYKLVIFIHGCFWHGCPVCKHAQIRPVNNAEYWNKKLDRNKERDKNNVNELTNTGWNVLIIWECETKIKKRNVLINKIQEKIHSINEFNNKNLTGGVNNDAT